MSPRAFLINGKFLNAAPTGVHRVATEIVLHLDRLLRSDPAMLANATWELACPRNAHEPMTLRAIVRRKLGRLTWQAWEQIDLPRAARGKTLLNLCNIAPLSANGAVTLIHDAHVFLTPQSSSPLFIAWYRFALPKIGARASRIVTISGYSRDRLIEFGVAAPEKIVVIPNGCDHILRSPADVRILESLAIKPGGYVMALSNVQAHKNIAFLFEVMSQPAMKDIKLVLFGGDGPQAFATAGFKPPANVVFAGKVRDNELRALYEGAICLAFPSTTEGFGLPPLEAMLCSCPALIAPCGALPEVCGEAAVHIEPTDREGWTKAILRMIEDKPHRDSYVARGLAHAAGFKWADSVRRLHALLTELR